MPIEPTRTRRRAALDRLLVGLTAITCAGLLTAAILVPAPAAVVPLIVVVCIAFPMAAAYGLSRRIAVLREARALKRMRRGLDRLPETQHPLGL